MNILKKVLPLVLVAAVLNGCFLGKNKDLDSDFSYRTGWKFFDKNTVHFEAYEGDFSGIPTGMVAIEGGTFAIGQMDEFLTAPRNNERRSISVSSFYMDKYEVDNESWREYLSWNQYVFGDYKPELIKAIYPDTTVWRDEMAYNEPYVDYYLNAPNFAKYPVVGVSWVQAMGYCQWRTDRVNELILQQQGFIRPFPYDSLGIFMNQADVDNFLQNNAGHPEYKTYQTEEIQVPESKLVLGGDPNNMIPAYRVPYEWVRDHFVFNTEKYYSDANFTPTRGKSARMDASNNYRKINRTDGILFIGYRLPTEAEWEYAAYAPVADENGIPQEGRIYPWKGYHPRDISKENLGKMRANFIRSRGDMAGVAGAPNDGYVFTAPVDEFCPNDFGLYNMAGNVNEWVLDVYREMTFKDMTEYNSFRGNIYSRLRRDSVTNEPIKNEYGQLMVTYDPETDDKRNYMDGDSTSMFITDYPLDTVGLKAKGVEFKIDPTDILVPRISNTTRVYKGGSWNDRIYWLDPTTRRYMDENSCSSTVGFRCAMTMLGNQALQK